MNMISTLVRDVSNCQAQVFFTRSWSLDSQLWRLENGYAADLSELETTYHRSTTSLVHTKVHRHTVYLTRHVLIRYRTFS